MLSSAMSFKSSFEKNQIEMGDFHFPEHQTIFMGLQKLYFSGSDSDVHLLSDQLKRLGKLETAGGIEYLTSLACFPGTSAHFDSYFALLKELAARRKFVTRCDELKRLVLGGEKEASTVAALASMSFNELSRQTSKRRSLSLVNLSKGEGRSFFEQLCEKQENGMKGQKWSIPGFSSGFSFIDGYLGGFRKENLIILAARPSVGKTAFALNLLRNIGMKQNIGAAFFSLEMTANQLFLRLLSAQSGVGANKIETGQLSESQMEQIETALQQLENSPIFINDSCYEISSMIAQMRSLVDEHNIAVFFIDYVGLIQPAKEREIKAYEIGDITRSLKNCANELKVPIICLAQLNRQAEQNHRPQLSMLKDSGNLEQDADSVLFLHRRDLYDPNDRPDQIEVIVAKNRHGNVSSRFFQFAKEIGVVSELVEENSVTWD